eukprot:gnl/MRDRNA2_/MRDRNA2_57768_c0_seq1.p1 gnl/MRDRNA2_/MRDRNA2_57768_c0~~gnl/MRDRNA2_/MRDRNA2_57768_c0_seq1.p1  ORF type:complete len:845 (-),score=157.28 gnl/MRDRNA2_/MRDRNA2_57768_c0_seq1:223-2757(-)
MCFNRLVCLAVCIHLVVSAEHNALGISNTYESELTEQKDNRQIVPHGTQRRRTAVTFTPGGEMGLLRREDITDVHKDETVSGSLSDTGIEVQEDQNFSTQLDDQEKALLQARIKELESENRLLHDKPQTSQPQNILEVASDFIYGRQPPGEHKKMTPEKKKELKEKFDSKDMQIMFGICLCCMIAFEIHHLTKMGNPEVKVDFTKEVGTDEQLAYDVRALEYSKSLFLMKRSFPPHTRVRSAAIGVSMVVMNLAFLWIQYKMNDFTGKFWDMMVARDWSLFVTMMKYWFFVGSNWMIVSIYMSYVNSMLLLEARTSLTFHMSQLWLSNSAFHHVELNKAAITEGDKQRNSALDNPDQRIADDCDSFTGSTLDIVTGLMQSVGRLCVFLPVLWRLSPKKAFGTSHEVPGWLLYTSMLYALVCALAVHFISRGLITLNYLSQMVEANFRSALIRVRDNAESVAMMNAESAEINRLETVFESVQRLTWENMFLNKRLGAVMSVLDQVGGFYPYFLLAPSYFAGDVTLGVFFQTKGALDHVMDCLTWFSNSYGGICDWRATTNRLFAFQGGLTEARLQQGVDDSPFSPEAGKKKPQPEKPQPGSSDDPTETPPGGVADDDDADDRDLPQNLELSGMTLLQPDGSFIITDLSLTIERGSWVLLTGPEGSGKTTLLRAIAGIWPYVEPKELIGTYPAVLEAELKKDENSVFFLPQRASCLREGSLREAVAYPLPVKQFTDEQISSALFAAGLNLENSLDDKAEWGRLLSGGESQRLNLAHAILRRPKWLFLDEPAASLPAEARGSVYAALREHLPKDTTVVSVDHDPNASKPYHDVHYAVDPLSRNLIRK